MQKVLEGVGDGVWDWNLVTGVEYFSPRLKAMYGYEDHELKFAAELDALTHPDDVARMAQDREAHWQGRVPAYRNEHRVRHRDGRWLWVLTRGLVVSRDADGKPLRMVGTHTDITERVAAQLAQRELEAQLREAQRLEALGTLAGGVAQDFNNLLSVMLGNLELVRRDMQLPVSALRGLGEVAKAAERAQALVQQILAFSRQQAQHMAVLDLGALLHRMEDLLRSLLPPDAQLTLRLPSAPLRVLADSAQLQQVVLNLCTNAWQSLQGGPGEVWLSVYPASDGSGACLTVEDSGPGIPAAVLARVFEPFFTTRPSGEGSGLGLSVVHGIVKAHQGRTVVTSPPGQGARFEVWLPLVASAPSLQGRQPSAPHAQLPAPSVPNPLATGTDGQSDSVIARHVVYIDDYEAMVYLVTRMLRKRGYRVTAFERAEQALAFIQAQLHDVDLLVTDYNMPGLSGLDVVRQVKQWRPDLPMVITSGHVAPGMQADALAEGVVQVLNKQDSVDDLAQCLAELLERLPQRAANAG